MAIRTSREFLIEAPSDAVVDALADVSSLPSYSSMHKLVKVVGLADTEMLEYRWGPN